MQRISQLGMRQMNCRVAWRQIRSAPPKAEMTVRNTLGQSMEIVGRNSHALTIFASLIGVAALISRFGSHLEAEIAASKAEIAASNAESKAEIAASKAESKAEIALANLKIESLRRETESKIKEAQSGSERLAIEYQLKYKHSQEYVSLQKPEKTTTPLD